MLQITITEIDEHEQDDIDTFVDTFSNEVIINLINNALEIIDETLKDEHCVSSSKLEKQLTRVSHLLFSAQLYIHDEMADQDVNLFS